MTKAEAIAMLKRIQEPEAWEPQINQAAFEALDMAIKALEQQPCEDTIGRQAAIDAAALSAAEWDGMYVQDINGRIREALEKLPSAQPEQRWIPCSERLPDKNGKYLCSIQSNFKRKKIMRISTTDFESGINRWSPDCMAFKDRVIAWMPLPEPYKG